MVVFGLAGWSGSGKTTMLARLLPALIARGISVSTVKHAHHGFDVDQPGKDSHRHRQAGAREVMISSARRWALMHELRAGSDPEPEPDLDDLLARMSPVDLVLVEGFKRAAYDKLEIHRAALAKPLLAPEDARIVAIAADQPVPESRLPRFPLDDIEGIAGFILAHLGLSPGPAASRSPVLTGPAS